MSFRRLKKNNLENHQTRNSLSGALKGDTQDHPYPADQINYALLGDIMEESDDNYFAQLSVVDPDGVQVVVVTPVNKLIQERSIFLSNKRPKWAWIAHLIKK